MRPSELGRVSHSSQVPFRQSIGRCIQQRVRKVIEITPGDLVDRHRLVTGLLARAMSVGQKSAEDVVAGNSEGPKGSPNGDLRNGQ
jgi:hypothetical protein